MAVKPIPDEYPRVIPYLIVKDVSETINFLKEVFNAEEKEKMTLPDGSINHGEVKIGDSVIMIGKSNEQFPPLSAMIYIYVEDTDEAYNRALKLSAESVMEPSNQFYGDRNAGVKDSNGIQWWIASHVEDVSAEEMEKRNKQRAEKNK
jgi:PhnB protein